MRAAGGGNGPRRCPSSPGNLQQARTAKTLNRIDCHGLPLKNPARYGNSQRRIAKMPDSHNSLPTPEPTLGSTYGVPSFTHITPVQLAGTAHKSASPRPEVTGGAIKILTSGVTRSAEAGRERTA